MAIYTHPMSWDLYDKVEKNLITNYGAFYKNSKINKTFSYKVFRVEDV